MKFVCKQNEKILTSSGYKLISELTNYDKIASLNSFNEFNNIKIIYNSDADVEKEVETVPDVKTPSKEVPQKNPYEVEVPNVQPNPKA